MLLDDSIVEMTTHAHTDFIELKKSFFQYI